MPEALNSASPPATDLEIAAVDGYPLSARRYPATRPERGRVLVAAATGVPQGFYRRFAEYAASRGYTTLTFDYRGVGRSAPRTLRGFEASFLDWAWLDLPAMVDALACDRQPVFLVGHSFGGQAFGLLPNHHKVSAVYAFGTGAGWHGWMPRSEQWRVLAMWRLAGPLITRWKGYLAWKALGLGEDLPLGVYRQWRRWCARPHYFFDDPEFGPEAARHFAGVRTPFTAAAATDDRWAPPRSRDAFMKGYPASYWHPHDIDVHAAALGPIGHMGYFRAHARPLWADALSWFDALSRR